MDRESFPAEEVALLSIGITPEAKDRAIHGPPLSQLLLLLTSLQRVQDRLHRLPSSLGIPVWIQPAENIKVCLKARS